MPTSTMELAERSDGLSYHRVTLAIEDDGALSLHSLNVGSAELAQWGVDVEDLTLTVPHEEVARLTLALAAELLNERDGAARLREICHRRGIPIRVADWS